MLPRSLLCAALFAVWGCGASESSANAAGMLSPSAVMTTVNIMGPMNDQSFSPNPAPIAPGSLVVWHNADSASHRIVMNDGSFDSGDIAPGASSAVMRLTTAGGSYHCTIHPTMMFGSINAATSAPPSSGPSY